MLAIFLSTELYRMLCYKSFTQGAGKKKLLPNNKTLHQYHTQIHISFPKRNCKTYKCREITVQHYAYVLDEKLTLIHILHFKKGKELLRIAIKFEFYIYIYVQNFYITIL